MCNAAKFAYLPKRYAPGKWFWRKRYTEQRKVVHSSSTWQRTVITRVVEDGRSGSFDVLYHD